MIDVSELMSDPDFASTITVTRTAAGAYNIDGVYVPGVATTFDQLAVVQPASADDKVNYLPEGERVDSALRIYSNPGLQMSDGADVQSDTFVWQVDGQHYRVAYAKSWDAHGYHFAIGVGYVQDDPINLALRRLIRLALALPDGYMRPANQSKAPTSEQRLSQDKGPFGTVLIKQAVAIGLDLVREMPDPSVALNLLQLQSGMYHCVGSVQFFRQDAVSFGRRLKGALQTAEAIDYMQSQNMGLIDVGMMQNLTSVIDADFEERAGADVEFYITIDTSRSLPTYGTFPISVTLGSESANFEVSEP